MTIAGWGVNLLCGAVGAPSLLLIFLPDLVRRNGPSWSFERSSNWRNESAGINSTHLLLHFAPGGSADWACWEPSHEVAQDLEPSSSSFGKCQQKGPSWQSVRFPASSWPWTSTTAACAGPRSPKTLRWKMFQNSQFEVIPNFPVYIFPKSSIGSKGVDGIQKVLETISRNWDGFSVGWPWVHTAARFSRCFLVTIAGECLSNKRTQVLKQHETHHKIISWYCFEIWNQTWYTGIPQKFNIGSM